MLVSDNSSVKHKLEFICGGNYFVLWRYYYHSFLIDFTVTVFNKIDIQSVRFKYQKPNFYTTRNLIFLIWMWQPYRHTGCLTLFKPRKITDMRINWNLIKNKYALTFFVKTFVDQSIFSPPRFELHIFSSSINPNYCQIWSLINIIKIQSKTKQVSYWVFILLQSGT